MNKRSTIINEFNDLADLAIQAVGIPEDHIDIAMVWEQRLLASLEMGYELGLYVEIAKYALTHAHIGTYFHHRASTWYSHLSEKLANRNETHLSGCLETIWAMDPVEPHVPQDIKTLMQLPELPDTAKLFLN